MPEQAIFRGVTHVIIPGQIRKRTVGMMEIYDPDHEAAPKDRVPALAVVLRPGDDLDEVEGRIRAALGSDK